MEPEAYSQRQLSNYLDKLDKSLGQISASDRADIIVEIKSHINEAQSRHPEQTVTDIIASLGEAESVGNKYILERGLKPVKPPRAGGTIMKWLVIGFLGTMALFLLSIALLIWKFTPIIAVDDQNQKVTILGGLINIDGNAGKFQVGNATMTGDPSGHIVITGARTLTPGSQITVPFKNGEVDVKTTTDSVMTWSCALLSNQSPNVEEKPGDLTVDFTGSNDTKCELGIPVGSRLSLSGGKGRVTMNQPEFDVDVKLGSGKVELQPKENIKYQYDLKVKTGKIERFESMQPAKYKVNVEISSGKIGRVE